MNLEIVRQLPLEGVKATLLKEEGKVIRNGRRIVEFTILDEGMKIVAIGQITALLVPVAKRSAGDRN